MKRADCSDESRRVVAGLQATYAEQSGVSALKVKHNNVLGYFIEVSAKNADALMGDDRLHPPSDHGERRALLHARTG
jgi:DNA mismatch repair ATPase MutS